MNENDRVFVELNDLERTIVDISNLLYVNVDSYATDRISLIFTFNCTGDVYTKGFLYESVDLMNMDKLRIKNIIKKQCGLIHADAEFAIK